MKICIILYVMCYKFIVWLTSKDLLGRWCLRGVMVKVMDCGIVVSEFELQSSYYIHFGQIPLGNEPSYPSSYELNSIPTVLLEGWLWR